MKAHGKIGSTSAAVVVSLFSLYVAGGANSLGSNQPGQCCDYQLTIFVDEAPGKLNGHVFVRLTDGHNFIYRGFYPKESLEGLGGGEVRDDKDHSWTVAKDYDITRDDFNNALRGIERVRTEGRSWWIDNHCGDFAEGVARAAGVVLQLDWTPEGRNRPAIFGQYLRQHGGIVNADPCGCESQFDVCFYKHRQSPAPPECFRERDECRSRCPANK